MFMTNAYSSAYPSCRTDRNLSFAEIVTNLAESCDSDPAFSALLSVLVRSAPIFDQSAESIEKNKTDSYNKEIEASTSLDRPQVLDYSVWFSTTLHPERALSSYLPTNDINHLIHTRFREWKEFYNHHEVTLYPQLTGYKNTSRQTAFKYREVVGKGEWDDDIQVNCVDLERFYAETGIQVGGACELRQAWKFNDLTPRTYFAIGGTAFHHSKYIRPVANAFCNIFPSTNFISRYSTNRLCPETRYLVFTYDYSTFTSNLTELKYFLGELAEYMEDAPVIIVDSRNGLIYTTVGRLLQDYLLNTTLRPEFAINRFISSVLEPLHHSKAGMLGVYGNIALSTGLHGLHALQLCGSGDCNCVGDDVLGVGDLDEEIFLPAVSSLGSVNPSKIRSWNFRDPMEEDNSDSRKWPYTKRPLERFGNFILHHHSYNLPIFGSLIPLLDDVHDNVTEGVTRSQLKILSAQIRSLVNQLVSFPLQGDQLELITEYCAMIYKEMGISENGIFPWDKFTTVEGTSQGLHIPPIIALSSGNFWEGVGEAFTPGWFKVPETTSVREDFLGAGIKFQKICVKTRVISYGSKMEWLQVQRRDKWAEFISADSYRAFSDDLYLRRRLALFDVTLLKCPSWFLDLLHNEL
jgi:hypothetical protein